MIDIVKIEKELEEKKSARKEGLPIAEWRKKALDLFNVFRLECDIINKDVSTKMTKSLTRKLAFDCKAELENYFANFGFDCEEEKDKWGIISEQLKKIYLS